MNHGAIKANAEAMLAFVNGKTIQYRRKSSDASFEWNDVDPNSPFLQDFTFVEFEYRIKPTPEEFFITVYGNPRHAVQGGIGDEDRVGGAYSSETVARAWGRKGARIFKVVEVQE